MRTFTVSAFMMVACLAGASAASAGTSTANGTATMSVINQCTITGANVSLGTFRTTDTLQTVANQTGYWDGDQDKHVVGTNGVGSVSLGSVTCDIGTPYSITMDSNGWYGGVEFQMQSGTVLLFPFVKKIGDKVFTGGSGYMDPFGIWPSTGNLQWYGGTQLVNAIATGAPQQIMGNVIPWVSATTEGGYLGTDLPLGQAGVYTGSWTTTLNF